MMQKYGPSRSAIASAGVPQCSVLSNGIRVISDKVPHVQTFALGIWVECGSRDDTLPGIAHMLEHVLFRRSQRYSGTERARLVESLGAYLNASTSKEQTCYYVRGLAEHVERLADLLIELVFAPAFTATDIEKERRIILEELRAYDDDPEEVVCDHLEAVLFGSHPLAHPIAGEAVSVERITEEALREFYRQWYVGSRCAIIISGPFEHQWVMETLERLLGRWDVPVHPPVVQQRRRPHRLAANHVTIERSFQQAHLAYGIRTEGAKSPSRHALALLNIVLGDSISSRLYRRIRERRALAYSVYSWLQLLSDSGELGIYASTHPARLDIAIAAIEEEIARLRAVPPTLAEYRRAREQLRASLIMSTESLSARVHYIARMLFDEGQLDALESSIAAIETVSLAELREIAASIAEPSAWSSVICC